MYLIPVFYFLANFLVVLIVIFPLHLQLLLGEIITYVTTYSKGHKKSSQAIYSPPLDIFLSSITCTRTLHKSEI